ncbi:MAG TPA: hypothetical protein VJZ00_20590 [Thermoanaerobaculia bacterium]|nr:hypothetical protein [Thermoanaerobaculia bacterium]
MVARARRADREVPANALSFVSELDRALVRANAFGPSPAPLVEQSEFEIQRGVGGIEAQRGIHGVERRVVVVVAARQSQRHRETAVQRNRDVRLSIGRQLRDQFLQRIGGDARRTRRKRREIERSLFRDIDERRRGTCSKPGVITMPRDDLRRRTANAIVQCRERR